MKLLEFATQEVIRQLKQDKMLSLLDFHKLCQSHYKEDGCLGFTKMLRYDHYDYSALHVKIKCNYLGTKFKATFKMRDPIGKFEGKSPIAYNLEVQEID
ncbi:hypothetical protein [Leeuwenhoekiella aequorea]|uniref:Uncharacterized protein n=1 Tax=Leeuwenhoekiella aequorea TaxID=283736 RepID=A0A4Q0PBU7_9FLAO|nr:hypothetical protein [Leeuwenhoekiella aequorea]RXG24293.1 hypothetical protein DSM00_79 [Leeuwenhoekiella aequorea]